MKGHKESIKAFKSKIKEGYSNNNYFNDILDTTEICLELSGEI